MHASRRIVSNTGPLLHLGEAGSLRLLGLAGSVQIPGAVAKEIRRLDSKWLRAPSWVAIGALAEVYDQQALSWQQSGMLDAGEAEALALARQIGADWFLTDDAAARTLAQTLGIETHGSLGVLLWAAAVGHLEKGEAEESLLRLSHSSLWISKRVLAEARTALARLFD